MNIETNRFHINNLFQWLNSPDDQGSRPKVNIPATVIFRHGVIRNWYFTSTKDGTVRRKKRSNLRKSMLLDEFCKGAAAEEVVGSFLYYENDSGAPGLTNGPTVMMHLTAMELQHMMTHPLDEQKHGILQKWVVPRGFRNSVIRCTWAPLLLQLEKRTTIKNMSGKGNLYERVVTFEGSTHDSEINTVNSTLTKTQIKGICDVLAQHFGQISIASISIHQMTMYLKVGDDSRIWLLWCSHIATTLKPLPGISHSAPMSQRKARLNSPPLTVPPNTEYSRRLHSVMAGVPCCGVCGRTVGRPDPVGEEAEGKEQAGIVSMRSDATNDLIEPGAVVPVGAGPNGDLAQNRKSPRSFYAQNSGIDECGAWSLTYETILRYNTFLEQSEKRRRASHRRRNGGHQYENENDDEMAGEEGDDAEFDGRALSPLSTVANPDDNDRLESQRVPPLLRRMEPWLTAEKLAVECRKADFLQKSIRVCDICHSRYTMEGALPQGSLDDESASDKLKQNGNLRRKPGATEYPQGLLPDYCSVRTYKALQSHTTRYVSGESMRQKKKILSMLGDDVPEMEREMLKQKKNQDWRIGSKSHSSAPSIASPRYSTKGRNFDSAQGPEILQFMELRKRATSSIWDVPQQKDPVLGMARALSIGTRKLASVDDMLSSVTTKPARLDHLGTLRADYHDNGLATTRDGRSASSFYDPSTEEDRERVILPRIGAK